MPAADLPVGYLTDNAQDYSLALDVLRERRSLGFCLSFPFLTLTSLIYLPFLRQPLSPSLPLSFFSFASLRFEPFRFLSRLPLT